MQENALINSKVHFAEFCMSCVAYLLLNFYEFYMSWRLINRPTFISYSIYPSFYHFLSKSGKSRKLPKMYRIYGKLWSTDCHKLLQLPPEVTRTPIYYAFLIQVLQCISYAFFFHQFSIHWLIAWRIRSLCSRLWPLCNCSTIGTWSNIRTGCEIKTINEPLWHAV